MPRTRRATPVGFSAGSLLSHTRQGLPGMFRGHRRPRALLEKWPHDSRKPGSRDGRIPGWIAQRLGGRGRRPHLRLERIEVLDFGRVQQVSPSPVVVGAERGAADPGLRGPQRQPSTHGAEAGPVASVEAGDLQGPRPPHSHGSTGGAGNLSGALAASDRKALPRFRPYEAKQCDGPGALVRS